MPYVSKEDKKAFYHRHQKHYQKKFIAENREWWNEYQRSRKVEKRKEEIENIKKLVTDLKIDKSQGVTYRAAVIGLLLFKIKIEKDWAIAYRTGYDVTEIKGFVGRWTEAGYYKKGRMVIDGVETEQEFIMKLSLVAHLGTGYIVLINERSKK